MSLIDWLRRIIEFFVPPEEPAQADPVEIFEDAIRATRQKLLDLRATASPLYQSRDALLLQETSHARDLETLSSRALELMQVGREKEALAAAQNQGRLEGDLERVRRELADLLAPLTQVEARLAQLEADVRALENERDRSRAALRSADARIAVDRILSAHAESGPDPALAAARDLVSRKLDHARAVESLGAAEPERTFARLDAEVDEADARRRLAALSERPRLPATRPDDPPAGDGSGE